MWLVWFIFCALEVAQFRKCDIKINFLSDSWFDEICSSVVMLSKPSGDAATWTLNQTFHLHDLVLKRQFEGFMRKWKRTADRFLWTLLKKHLTPRRCLWHAGFSGINVKAFQYLCYFHLCLINTGGVFLNKTNSWKINLHEFGFLKPQLELATGDGCSKCTCILNR